MTAGEFIECRWYCGKCGDDGRVCIYAYTGQPVSIAAEDHARWTRARCVTNCLYRVEPPRNVALASRPQETEP